MAHRLMHFAAVAKAHFDLGRMHIDIDARRVHFHIQGIHRLALAVQHVFIRAARRVGEHLVTHITAVDIGKLLVGPRAGGVRNAGAAPNANGGLAVGAPGTAFVLHSDGLRDEIAAQHIGQALVICKSAAAGTPLLMQLAVVPHREADLGPHQCVAANRLNAVGQLGGVGFQELAACRRCVKQLAHFDAGAAGAWRRFQLAGAAIELPGVRRVQGSGHQSHVGDRIDGRQRLAPKAHGHHRLQVVQRGNLAGGMASERQRQLFARNAQAVVFHRNQANAAGL